MGRELTRGWFALHAMGGAGLLRRLCRAGFSCLALVVEAESTCLAGSASLAGLRGLAGSSDPAKRVPVLRGSADLVVFEEDPGSVACPGSIPPTVVPEAVKVRRLWMSGPSQFPP